MAHIRVGRKSGFIVRGGRSVRQMLWLADTWTQTVLASASATALVSSLNAAALALRPFTIIRTHSHILYGSDQTGTTEDQSGGMGMTIVTDQAITAGVGSIPTPSLVNSADWFALQMLASNFTFITGIGTLLDRVHYDIDSRAMRKVDVGSDLAVVVDNSGLSTGAVIQAINRILIKLH